MLELCLNCRWFPIRVFLFDNEAAWVCSILGKATRVNFRAEYVLIRVAWDNLRAILLEADRDKQESVDLEVFIYNREAAIQVEQSNGFRW